MRTRRPLRSPQPSRLGTQGQPGSGVGLPGCLRLELRRGTQDANCHACSAVAAFCACTGADGLPQFVQAPALAY
jgi:hypothetical protein